MAKLMFTKEKIIQDLKTLMKFMTKEKALKQIEFDIWLNEELNDPKNYCLWERAKI